MPWKGFNFEDAIVISERVVRDDYLHQYIHVDEYVLKCVILNVVLEELTADIPNVSEEATKNLDENGLIRSWNEVKRRRYSNW